METTYFTAILLVLSLSSVLTSCPSGSNDASEVTGTNIPLTPSVTVGGTCYEVDVLGTVMFECKDSRGESALQSARWLKAPSYTPVIQSTGSFINGDIANPNLTVSNAQASYAGDYVCQLCYGSSYTQCTNGSTITLVVRGSVLTSVSATVSSTRPLRGSQVTFTCTVQPAGAAASYKWYYGTTQVGSSETYTVSFIGTSQDGTYRCEATDSFSTVTSFPVDVDVQYTPEPSGGTTVVTTGNLQTSDIVITCNMNANPAVSYYVFYNDGDSLLQNSSSNTYTVTSSNGYQVYSCQAYNSVGLSSKQYLDVQEESTPGVGAATEDTGIGTGTIAAIILGIIFLLLLIIIIIVCCCSYGMCRKKEKVQPEVVIEKPVVRPYIPSVSASFEEPRYTTPKYHLKPAINGGPIISMYDDGYEQPRARQLPALDTHYLYPRNELKKLKRKKRRRHSHRHHEDMSPERQYHEPEHLRYAEIQAASDEDIVVIQPRQTYFE